MRRASAIVFVSAIMLVGCAAGGSAPTIVGVLPETKGRDDPFSPWQEHTTAMLRTGAVPNVTTVRLIGRKDRKTGAVTTHARVAIYYEDHVKRYYDTARDARAEPLRVTVITRDFPLCGKRPCRYSEEVMVDLPEAELRNVLANGKSYPFKMFSRVGKESLVNVPKELVASLLASVGQSVQAVPEPAGAARPPEPAAPKAAGSPRAEVMQPEDDE